MIDPNTVILIGGPTASGKTGLSVDLAKHINGVILNADSMQVYRELQILTARPTQDEMDGIDHRLFGFQPITEHYSVAHWRKAVLNEIDTIHQAGQIPILVGGTGFYFKSLLDGLSLIPEVDHTIRQRVSKLYDDIGAQEFYKKLEEIDPITAERLPPTDRQRCIRAVEVFEATDKTLSDWQKEPRIKAPDHLIFKTFIFQPDRAELYDRINLRFDQMIDQGALDEVKAIHALNPDPLLPSLKAVGLPPLRAHLDGEIILEDAIATAKTQSRQYAKRQFTWFNNQMPEQKSEKLSISHIKMPEKAENLLKHLD